MNKLRLRTAGRADLEEGREPRRVVPATAVSLVLHVLLVAVLIQALAVPMYFQGAFSVGRAKVVPVEHLRLVEVQPGATGGDGRPRAAQPAATPLSTVPAVPTPPLVSTTEVPTSLPPVTTGAIPAPAPGGGAGTGPLAGGNGPTSRVQPTYNDPRVWVADPALIYAPKTEIERLDSALVTSLRKYQDSVALYAYKPNKFERGDWTIEKDGKKYGIDQQYIRLGRFSIPTALLALLPFNRMQGNPIEMDRARAQASMRADILYHAAAAINEEEFRKAVKAIRDRKDREHRAIERATARRDGSTVSPGDRPPQ